MAGPRQVKAKAQSASQKGARILVVEARYYDAIADTLLAGVKRVLEEAVSKLRRRDGAGRARNSDCACDCARCGAPNENPMTARSRSAA